MIDERTVFKYNRLSVCAKLIRPGIVVGQSCGYFAKRLSVGFPLPQQK